jgi:hypothetical protein
LYGDDTGYHHLATLGSTTDTTFRTSFLPTLLDSRLKLRIIHNESTSVSINIDRLYVYSYSTDEINDLIIEGNEFYDLYYANLAFKNPPSLVSDRELNIPLSFKEIKQGVYYVFEFEAPKVLFTVDRVKIIGFNSDHNKTILSTNYYHIADNEIYIDSSLIGNPVAPNSILNVDISYTYDSWERDEYVDTQPYVHPQIKSWFFGTTDEQDMYKKLSYKLYKDVNLLEIEFYDFLNKTWISIPYVVYDLNDRDARTFGYFIDRIAVDFVNFDLLPQDDLIYQLKYRFKIDKDYFSDEYSTKTFFDMEELTVQMLYNPVDSVVSLNPRLTFSADITDIIHPDGDTSVKAHVNELSFDLKWKNEVYVSDTPVDGVDINEVFNNLIYSDDVDVYVLDKFGVKHTISKTNGKYYLKHTNEESLYDFIQHKYGRYYVDFFLNYEWELKGIIQYVYDAIFTLHATIEVTKCDVRAKTTTIVKELITSKPMVENCSIYIGDITGNSVQDVGFARGFLERKDNNERFFIKYQFSYLYDSDNDDAFDCSLDSRVYFAEIISDV